MRKITFLRAISLLLIQTPLVAQPNYPYTTSTVQGSNVMTNDYDPNAGPATGPGLPISPLESRLYGPLGQPFTPGASTSSSVNASTANYANPSGNSYGTGAYTRGNKAYGALNSGGAPSATYGSSFDAPPSDAYPMAPPSLPPRGFVPRSQPLEPIFRRTNDGVGVPSQPSFLSPGLVRYCIDKWVGSDYLYEMSPNIGVVVEVVNPLDFSFSVDSNLLKSYVENIFNASEIFPVAESVGDQAPLPFFHVLIFVVPAGESFVFSLSARLFEPVRLFRLDYRLPGTVQAITWEKQGLIVAPEGQLINQMIASVKEVAEIFTERVRYFRRLKLEQDDALRLRCGAAAVPVSPQREGDSRNYANYQGFKSGCGSEVNIVGCPEDLSGPQNSRSTQSSEGRYRAPCRER
ncbi:MAG: hypothetical protein ACXWM7_07130 [Parachlamydiaceae bacterium]